ncbi:MAG: sugar ABC transporter substrate-binding protein [Firmicutes bacterium]|nr:sugar ABC transporter substrate-binding protein [Bacillota bacterium]
MKRILSMPMLIMIVIVLIVGCGTQKQDRYANDIVIADKGNNHLTGDSVRDKVTDIILWRPSADDFESEWYRKGVEAFNEANKGKIHVTIEVITRGDSFAYEDRVNVAAASGGLPDVLAVDGPNISNYAFSNILVPLDPFFEKEELTDFVSSIIDQGTYSDKLYALGICESTVVLFYNKKLLSAARIQPPTTLENAWTWEEFYEVSKELTRNGVYGTNLINDQGEWMTYCFEQFWISNNVDIISENGVTTTGYLNSPAGIEAAAFLQKMAQEKLFNIKPTPTEFEEGKAATKLGGPWNITRFEAYPDLEWGVTYFPYKLVKTSPSGSWALGISGNSKHPYKAAEVIKVLTNKSNAIAYSKASNMPASRKSAYEAIPEYDKLPLRILKEQVTQTANLRPRTPIYPILTKKFAEVLNDIMMGADVKRELDNMAKEIDNEYKHYYSTNQ